MAVLSKTKTDWVLKFPAISFSGKVSVKDNIGVFAAVGLETFGLQAYARRRKRE
jgi:hypothetical protein